MAKGKSKETDKPSLETEKDTSLFMPDSDSVFVSDSVKATKPTPKKAETKTEPLMTFDRFFAHTGRPIHHKLGMLAYAKRRGSLKSKRTVSAWTELFSTY